MRESAIRKNPIAYEKRPFHIKIHLAPEIIKPSCVRFEESGVLRRELAIKHIRNIKLLELVPHRKIRIHIYLLSH